MTIEKGDYYELRALQSDIDRLTLEARIEADRFKRQIADLSARRQQAFDRIVAHYGLDPAGRYDMNDAECSLTLVPRGGGEA